MATATRRHASDPFGTDLQLQLLHHRLRPVYAVAREGNDLAVVGGDDNLAQALTIRLLTPRGELAPLGHPDYGSRLPELIGGPSTAARRDVARLFVLEALAAEPRVAEVISVEVDPVPGRRALVAITIRLRPQDRNGELVLGPFHLELEP